MPRTFQNKKLTKVVESASVPSEYEVQEVHNVHLLDGSGSMGGMRGKFGIAVKGINDDLSSSADAAKRYNVTSTYSIYQFSRSGFSITGSDNFTMQSIEQIEVEKYNPRPHNSVTALYEAMGAVIEYFIANKKPSAKVLLKVFTDGGENASRGKYAKEAVLAELIRNAERNHNFTITFVGTREDVNHITRALSIETSNSLVHDNTEEGVRKAFNTTRSASMSYYKDVAEGNDVKLNFYTKNL